MTDQEIFQWGDKAHNLIQNDDYITIYDHVTLDLAKEWLSTAPGEHERRKELYNIYSGMRAFGLRLNAMVAHKEQVIERQEAESNQDEDESN